MKTDSILYRLFKTFPGVFFELLGQSPVEAEVSRKLVELIETIIVYKFPQKSQAEIQAMLGLGDLKQTKVYQEGLEDGERKGRVEGKLEAVPRLLKLGLTLEQVAEALEVDVAEVRKAAR